MNVFRLTVSIITISIFTLAVGASDEVVWRNVSQAEIDIKTPQVEADADAEALLWEVVLDDKKLGKLKYSNYVRLKIFTERGREKYSKIDIPYGNRSKIEEIAARVIRPDGSVVNIAASEIFDREIVKTNKAKVSAKSFAVPSLGPGSIVEYQYKESVKNEELSGERLYFDRDIPIQKIIYRLRGYSNQRLNFTAYNFEILFEKKDDGFQEATLANVPAFQEEPFMPPVDEVRKWVMVSYPNWISDWIKMSRNIGYYISEFAKKNNDVAALAQKVTGGAQTDEEKLRRIFSWAKANIRNLSFDSVGGIESDSSPKIKNAKDVLEKKMAFGPEYEMFCLAMARSVGLNTAIVLTGDRRSNFFDPSKYNDPSFIHPAGIAVKIGSDWKFFNPSVPFLGFGELVWYEEDTAAMVVGDSGFLWKMTPLSNETKSKAIRKAKLELSAEGTLSGLLTYEFSGQLAIKRREENWNKSAAKREENVASEIKERHPNAEILEASIQNLDNPDIPLVYSIKIRIPSYAQRTGKRLFFAPNVFESNAHAVFSSSSRKTGIFFSTPWSEDDTIEIGLPNSYVPETPELPPTVIDNQMIGRDAAKYSYSPTNRKITWTRNFYFGKGTFLLFPTKAYEPLKSLFDQFNKLDNFALSLKQDSSPLPN